MRTLEQLEKDDYENLTLEELNEYDLSCEQFCPLYGEFCSGGMTCYGGSPIEPLCISLKPEEILQQVYDGFYIGRVNHEKWEDEQLKKQQEKERKNKVAAEKRRQFKWRNYDDLNEIKIKTKTIKRLKEEIEDIGRAKRFSSAVNFVNKMFGECGYSHPEDIKYDFTPQILDLEQKILLLENEIVEIKNKIKLKEKELRVINKLKNNKELEDERK